MEAPPVLNLNKICRTCLLECQQMYSIYSELFEDQGEVDIGDIPCIYEILISISSIKVQADDGLPSMICTKCIDMAHTSFKFQKQCNQSQVILDAYMKQYTGDLEKVQTSPPLASADDLGTLEQINRNDLVEDAALDPNDFLLVEEEILDMRESIESTITKKEVEEETDCANVEITDPLHIQADEYLNLDELPTETQASKELQEPQKSQKSKRIYECGMCSKTFKHTNSLRVHMRVHTQERPFNCKTCGKSFTQSCSLLNHHRSHTGEQPYSCKICGKRYKQSGTLTAHMRVHTGQRPFLCSICGRGFRQAADLGYHMRCHTKEKPYMCNVCGKTMSMQSHLVQHMRIHTGEKPFECTVCGKAFPSTSRLKRHTIIHTDLKPFKCEVCAKSFNRVSTLKVHLKIHTDERTHVCPICHKGFTQAHTLRSHRASHFSELKHLQSPTVE